MAAICPEVRPSGLLLPEQSLLCYHFVHLLCFSRSANVARICYSSFFPPSRPLAPLPLSLSVSDAGGPGPAPGLSEGAAPGARFRSGLKFCANVSRNVSRREGLSGCSLQHYVMIRLQVSTASYDGYAPGWAPCCSIPLYSDAPCGFVLSTAHTVAVGTPRETEDSGEVKVAVDGGRKLRCRRPCCRAGVAIRFIRRVFGRASSSDPNVDNIISMDIDFGIILEDIGG